MPDSDSSQDPDFSPNESELNSDYESEVSDVEVYDEDGNLYFEPLIILPDTPSPTTSPTPALLNVLNPVTSLLPEGDSDVDFDLDFEPTDDDDDSDYEADVEEGPDGDISDDEIDDKRFVVETVHGVKRGAEKMEDSDGGEGRDLKRRRELEEEPPIDSWCGEVEWDDGEGGEEPPIDSWCGEEDLDDGEEGDVKRRCESGDEPPVDCWCGECW